MSFSRSKSSRFGDTNHKPLKKHLEVSSTRTIIKSSKPQDKPPVIEEKPVENQILSLSQPTSNTSLKNELNRETNVRPRSGSDVQHSRTSTPREILKLSTPEPSNEEFESATLLPDQPSRKDEKPIFGSFSAQLKTKSDEGDDTNNLADAQSENSSSTPKQSSGIPLRLKAGLGSPKQEPKKIVTPKSPKHPSSIPTRSGSPRVNFSPLVETKHLPPTAAKRNLENIFQVKKRKYDQLKKEITEKQKPFLDAYQALVQLKNQLEEQGKTVVLEDVKIIECKNIESESNLTGAGEAPGAINVEPELVDKMKVAIQEIPQSFIEVSQEIFQKRLILLDVIEKISSHILNPDELKCQIVFFKNDSNVLQGMLDKTYTQQKTNIEHLIQQWQALYKSSDPNGILNEELLRHQIEEQECKIKTLELQLKDALREKQESGDISDSKINELKDKIRHLEQSLNADKSIISDFKEKCSHADSKVKSLKSRVVELEKKNKEMESKLHDAAAKQRNNMEQLKNNEVKWSKEKEELVNKSKHDRQMLEKLTKDRSFFETRVKLLEERLEEQENKYLETESQLKEQVEHARAIAMEEKSHKETMEEKYDSMKQQIVEMEIRNKQAVDLVATRNMFEPNETDELKTEKEAELYTELIATRVALKAAEEQIQTYNREKLRFIDAIQSLQQSTDSASGCSKQLVDNVEYLSKLETKVMEYDDTICNQRIEICNLKLELENLKQKAALMNCDYAEVTKDSDLKLMLHEGKVKLEQSLKKSLEYEHKIIRYEHDLNRQGKQICEMENLLKIRDGLIAMMKSKKDELQMENDSLNKYANEVRGQLMQSKEEIGAKTETVSELATALETKNQLCLQLQKKVEELQASLSANNEKRFRLQESISVMEKQLQSSHTLSDEPEIQSRYDAGRNHLHEIKSSQDLKIDDKCVVPYSANESDDVYSEAMSHYKANKYTTDKTTIKDHYMTNSSADASISEYTKKWEKTYKVIGELQTRWKYIDQNLSVMTRNIFDTVPCKLKRSLTSYKSSYSLDGRSNIRQPLYKGRTIAFEQKLKKSPPIHDIDKDLLSTKFSLMQNQVSDILYPKKRFSSRNLSTNLKSRSDFLTTDTKSTSSTILNNSVSNFGIRNIFDNIQTSEKSINSKVNDNSFS